MSTEIEIRLSGSGGQGLLLGARMLAAALSAEGMKVAQSRSYEPTSRGGLSRSDLVVSDHDVDYPLVTALDYLVVMDEVAAKASTALLKKGAVVIIDSSCVTSPPRGDFKFYSFPLTEMARKLGNGRVANMLALGVLAGSGGPCALESIESAVRDGTPQGFRELNLKAVSEGYRIATADTGGPVIVSVA